MEKINIVIDRDSYREWYGDVHTIGLSQWNHPELQMVLFRKREKDIIDFMSDLCQMVADGRRFSDGDYYSRFFYGSDVRFREKDGCLRIIIADEDHCFPEDSFCNRIFRMQKYPLEMLKKPKMLKIVER